MQSGSEPDVYLALLSIGEIGRIGWVLAAATLILETSGPIRTSSRVCWVSWVTQVRRYGVLLHLLPATWQLAVQKNSYPFSSDASKPPRTSLDGFFFFTL